MKKAAVMLYPLFSMQEISCTTELFKFYGKEIVTFSAGREPVQSEDGFTILPDRPFEAFCREDFDCLLLPGIWEHPLSGAVPGRRQPYHRRDLLRAPAAGEGGIAGR